MNRSHTKITLVFLLLSVLQFGLSAQAAQSRTSKNQHSRIMAQESLVHPRRSHRFDERLVQRGSFVLTGDKLENPNAQPFSRALLIHCRAESLTPSGFVSNTARELVLAKRESCDDPSLWTYFDINQELALDEGYYLLGFENTIYSGYVRVLGGQKTTIALEHLNLPQDSRGTMFVSRDTSRLDEQLKLYFTTFVLGRHMFWETRYDWSGSELYIAGDDNDVTVARSSGYNDFFGAINGMFKTCDDNSFDEETLSQMSFRLCTSWKLPSFMGMAEFFDFETSGRFTEYAVTRSGSPAQVSVGHFLAATPVTSATTPFINVLPGRYRVEIIEASGKRSVRSLETSPAQSLDLQNYGVLPDPNTLVIQKPNLGPVPPKPNTTVPLPGASGPEDSSDVGGVAESCRTAQIWKTEWRAHCHVCGDDDRGVCGDAVEGCDRKSSQICEPMYQTK